MDLQRFAVSCLEFYGIWVRLDTQVGILDVLGVPMAPRSHNWGARGANEVTFGFLWEPLGAVWDP